MKINFETLRDYAVNPFRRHDIKREIPINEKHRETIINFFDEIASAQDRRMQVDGLPEMGDETFQEMNLPKGKKFTDKDLLDFQTRMNGKYNKIAPSRIDVTAMIKNIIARQYGLFEIENLP